ncbi:CRISPR-associated helicase Cas3', partial [uncultured Methanosphaera sp.]
ANLVDLYKQEKFGQYEGINEIREEAYQELTSSLENIDLNNKIYSITLPTGSGKTMSAFSFALKLRRKIKNEKNIIPRIIYTMPFLSIVDQNEEVLRKILNYSNYDTSDILIKHNSTSELSYVVNKNGTTKIQDDPTEKAELDVDKAEMLLEGWYSEIVITTFYQLAYTLISNKNKALRKFHNISNSIIIVDEAQSIPAKYNQIFKTALDYLSKKFNVWIIFMTATQPEIFKESDGILPLITNEQKYFDCFDRVNYVFHHTPMTIDDFKEKIVDIIQENNKDIMIVLNTISSSTEIFEYIQGYFDEEGIELYYLSGNIIPKEKLERIKKIKESNNRKVIVTTQLIEAGVNIDVDIIYRDFAVMDSIIQTAGRCNRNDKKEKGTVNIIHLINENKREYSSFIYDSTLLRLTEELTKDYTEISEKDFNLKISKKYYTEVNNRISHDASHNLEKIISTLKISNITHEFKLIEDDIEKIDVFIEINDEATEIWDKYNEIYSDKNLKNYEKKLKLKKINRQFNNYVLSIPTNLIGTVNYDKFIFHVGKNDIERKYNLNTGFIAQENENAYMI